MQRVARPGEGGDVIFLDVFDLGDGLVEVALFAEGEYRQPCGATLAMASSPSLQGPMGFSLEVMRTASGSMARPAPVPRHALLRVLRHGVFVEERQVAPAVSRVAMRPKSRRENRAAEGNR